jgi:uncharacterized RDD family membrane protein YckC
MNTTEKYIHDVLRNVPAPASERRRLETDLRAHLAEAVAAGQPPESVVARMGRPDEVAAELMATLPLAYAGFLPRLLAFALDGLFMCLVIGALAVTAITFSNLVPQTATPTLADQLLAAVGVTGAIISGAAAIGVLFLYFPLLEGRFGQTLGKRLLRLRVLQENGLPIGYRAAVLRRLSFYFEIWWVDALFIPFTDRRQRAFDLVARTVVIHDPR